MRGFVSASTEIWLTSSALIPIFNLADGGIGNQMNDMSVAMTLDGVPFAVTLWS